MYTLDILQKGIELLGITDPEIISNIQESNLENLKWLEEEKERLKEKEIFDNRHNVPQGLTKKEYGELKKEAQYYIDKYKDHIRKYPDFCYSTTIEREKWIKKKNTIILFMKSSNQNNLPDIKKAKAYPIEQLIDFNHSGFADCIFHTTGKQNTPSLHWDKKRNKAHCFSCGKDADSIDVYQQKFNVSTGEAIKLLSN